MDTTTKSAKTKILIERPTGKELPTGECPVCLDERRLISCFCQTKACAECWKESIAHSPGPARCMSVTCKTVWRDSMIVESLGKAYYASNADGGYRSHMKRYLAVVGEAQVEEVAWRIGDVAAAKEDFWKKIADQAEIKRIEKKLVLRRKFLKKASSERRKALEEEVVELNVRLFKLQHAIYPALRKAKEAFRGDSQAKKASQKVLCICPYEGCKSMILWMPLRSEPAARSEPVASGWRCMLDASHVVCGDCHEPKAPSAPVKEHRCDPNTLETVKSFNGTTKACPKCGTMIFRSEGCVIMWCTACNTGFDWKTLEILPDSRVHNPHYTEYRMRAQTQGPRACQEGDDDPHNIPIYRHPQLWELVKPFFRAMLFVSRVAQAYSVADVERRYSIVRDDNAWRLLMGEIDDIKWRRVTFLEDRKYKRLLLRAQLMTTLRLMITEELTFLSGKLPGLEAIPYASAVLSSISRMSEKKAYLSKIHREEGSFLGIKATASLYLEDDWFEDTYDSIREYLLSAQVVD